ncbi:D-amino acid dehydrogenase [Methyloligella sp. 2.7D]|uniref:D-amino acid dehydrogenase n=1 Tax=unclassified Methyloligella TaxID=2625955 RepID=UPI00157DFBE1|nr:D-amino acid dehydrogenase [Methyloligella sp. GL2]QKP76666.1 D-amino acid dehydrogenase [Methyloligella sp. GL2]
MAHIAIVGAGITGVTSAYALLEQGHDVTVFERHSLAAMETSYANGGQLSASNAEVWNHVSNVLKWPKSLFQPAAPLLLNLKPSWHKYSWLAEFLAQIPNYRKNTVSTVQLAVRSREALMDIAARENIDFDLEKRGILHIYEDKKSFAHAEKVNAMLKEGGLERRPVTPQEIASIEPALHGEFYGGFYTASDASGDIHMFSRGLAEVCRDKGATFHYDTEIHRIDAEANGVSLAWTPGETAQNHGACEITNADAVVICAGVASRRFAAMLGDRLNIYPVKGYSITVDLEDENSRKGAPWVSLLDDAAKIVSSRFGDNRLRIAGTAEFNGFNRDIREDRIAPLTAWSRKRFPDIRHESVVPWAGLRPMMPDMLPRVGPGKKPRVFYNTGHGHLGWTLSGGTAEILAACVGTQLS